MDVIEIRMAHDAYVYAGLDLPIMMRGFVSSVRRTQAMGHEGKPKRIVSVSGHDYGKILQRYQVFYLPSVPGDAMAMITSFPFFTKFGDFANVKEAGAFVQAVVDQVINPYLSAMISTSPNVAAVKTLSTDIQVSGGVVSPYGFGTFTQGTLLQLFRQNCDVGSWNELFIEDRADGPYLVYRPNPALDIVSGVWLMQGAAVSGASAPSVIEIDDTDVLFYDVGRSDANVANVFWVDSHRYALNYDFTTKALASVAPSVSATAPVAETSYGNVNPALYGWSKLEEITNQGHLDETDNGNGTAAGASRNSNNGYGIDWLNTRRAQLYAQNKDNVIFESGSMRVKGNEQIRAGLYVAYTHGNLRSLHYAEAVDHEFIPFGNYFTSISFARGTGFSDRIKQNDQMQSPYYAENVVVNP
ncbi:hypothetical protein [Pararobbsia silviterrae]|nr:hypothetical protein [Pararobbsia silviterrae]